MNDKLIASFQTLTKMGLTIISFIVLISIYLIQRDLDTVYSVPKMVSNEGFNGGFGSTNLSAPQASVKTPIIEIKYSYGTMSLFWPIIISSCCLIFCKIIRKQAKIFELINNENQLSFEALINIDSFFFYVSNYKSLKENVILWFIRWLPIIALVVHLFYGVIEFKYIIHFNSLNLLIYNFFQILFTFICIIIALSFPKFLKRLNKYFLETKTA
jgi:hypothetical protein